MLPMIGSYSILLRDDEGIDLNFDDLNRRVQSKKPMSPTGSSVGYPDREFPSPIVWEEPVPARRGTAGQFATGVRLATCTVTKALHE